MRVDALQIVFFLQLVMPGILVTTGGYRLPPTGSVALRLALLVAAGSEVRFKKQLPFSLPFL